MIAPRLRSPDHLTRVAPLGLRFWDEIAGSAVTAGLRVTAYPRSTQQQRVEAFTNRVGVYVLRGLPGMHDVEYGEGDDAFWASPSSRPFVIEVVDEEDRFLPFTLAVEAPVRGIVTWPVWPAASPPGVATVPLYSAPARPLPSGMAVLRADLRDPLAAAPAAWAVVEAQVVGAHMTGPSPARGVADGKGRVALILPYPEPMSSAFGSPGAGTQQSLVQQQWSLALRISYTARRPAPDIPDIGDLFGQPQATMWTDGTEKPDGKWVPGQPLTTGVLKFGQELSVRSVDAQSRSERPFLWVTEGSSP